MTLSHMDMHVQGTIMKTRTTPHHRSHTRCMAPGRVNIVDVHSKGCEDSRTRGRKPSCHKFLLTYPNEIMDGNMVGDGLKNNRMQSPRPLPNEVYGGEAVYPPRRCEQGSGWTWKHLDL